MGFTVYPAVDISAGRCVRPHGPGAGGVAEGSDDPVEVALELARAGARWLHVVDIDAATTGEPRNRTLLLEVVRRAPCPVQAGGGVRAARDVTELLGAGARRVVLSASARDDPEGLARIGAAHGRRLAGSIELSSEGGAVGVAAGAAEFEAAGVSLLILRDSRLDGTLAGPDVAALLELASLTPLPVVAGAGVGSLDDLRALGSLAPRGIAGAVVGRALREGRFSVREANGVADSVSID